MSPTITDTATSEETRALLLLARACIDTPGVALWQLSATVQRLGSARTALAGDFEPETRWELGVRTAARELRPDLPRAAASLAVALTEWLAGGLKLTTVLDDDYPLNLRFVYDR